MSVARDLAALFARPIAHRGRHACGAAGPVENSIEAAHAAIAGGYGIECDVRLSRDGEAIVFHDMTLDRLTSSSGRLADREAAALSRTELRGGGLIPTLADFLAAIDGKVPLVVEIKAEGGDVRRLTDRVLALAEGYRGALAVESFDPSVALHARRAGTTRPLGLVGPSEEPGADPHPAAAFAAVDFLSWSIAALPGLDASPDAGVLPLSSWTIRDRAQEDLALHHGAQIVFEGFEPRR